MPLSLQSIRSTIHLPTHPSIHPSVCLSTVHCPQALYHCSQLKSSPPPNTTKKPRMVRKMTAFPVITRPQAPHWICRREVFTLSQVLYWFSQLAQSASLKIQWKTNTLTIDTVQASVVHEGAKRAQFVERICSFDEQ